MKVGFLGMAILVSGFERKELMCVVGWGGSGKTLRMPRR